MSRTSDIAEGLTGWLSTVAYKMLPAAGGYVDRQDLIQEGVLAVLESGATDECLAKTVAVRAMAKYRDRQGLVRTSKGAAIVGRSQWRDLEGVAVGDEPTGVFWENLEADPAIDREALRTFREWAESSETAEEVADRLGVAGRTVRARLRRACEQVARRWGVDDPDIGRLEQAPSVRGPYRRAGKGDGREDA